MLIVDKLGRRVLFTIGGFQMLVSQIVVGSILAAELGDPGGISKGYVVLICICIMHLCGRVQVVVRSIGMANSE